MVGCNGAGPDDSDPPPTETVDLSVTGDLRDRVEEIENDLPGAGRNGFTVPPQATLDNWRTLIGTIIDGDTTEARSLIDDHFPSYALIEFTDTTTDDTYFLLQEAPSVEEGWGTVVVNPDHERNLAIEVPHASADLETHVEGADIFRESEARILVLTGTHRCSNQAASPCSGTTSVCGASFEPYRQSDMAHFVQAPFQVTHKLVTDRFPELTALNLHGNGREECEPVFLSSGVEDDTPQSIQDLHQALLERSVHATIPSTSNCPYVGSTNVQGRYTNGVGEPCTEEASSAEGTFIHIEQRLDFRQSADQYQALIDAVNETF